MGIYSDLYEPEPDYYPITESANPTEYHKNKDGTLIRIDEMTTSHLVNTYKMFNRIGRSDLAYKYYVEIRFRYPNTYRQVIGFE